MTRLRRRHINNDAAHQLLRMTRIGHFGKLGGRDEGAGNRIMMTHLRVCNPESEDIGKVNRKSAVPPVHALLS